MFKSLRLLFARITKAMTPTADTTPHQQRNTAEQLRVLTRLAMSNHCYPSGYDLMPQRALNQRQRRKRCRQAGK